MQFISQNMQFERGTIIKEIYKKFFKGKPFGKDESKKLAELSGVYSVKIDTSTDKLLECNWFNGVIDYNNIKQPQITKEELNNPDIKSLDDLYSFRKKKEQEKSNTSKEPKKEVDKESKEENKSTETKDTKKPETVKTEEPKTEVVVTSTPDEKLLVDTSGLTDKWNKKTVSDFNSFLDSIKQIEKYSDNEKENKTIKENFNNLKLIGFKGKLNEYMTCVLYNIKSNIIFELFKRYNKDKNTNESEIACFYDVFDFKSTSYKRQSEARQKPNKKERDEYLNQYCYVDFKLLPKEEKLA